MSSVTFNTEDVDQHTTHLVFGYIRNIQNSLKYIIPNSIILLCISFYYLREYFVAFGSRYTLDSDRKTITRIVAYGTGSAFGNVKISSINKGIHEWVFEILYLDTSMSFGITDYDDNEIEMDFCDNETSNNYSIRYSGYKVRRTKWEPYSKTGKLSRGDTLKMQLNLNTKQLIFYRKSKYKETYEGLGIAYENIECRESINYKMAITFLNEKSKVSLSEYIATI